MFALAANLPISGYAAKKIIDIVAGASDLWAVIGIVAVIAGAGGITIGLLATAKWLAKKYTKAYAAAW